MAKRGTAGLGLVLAAGLIIFAILAPGTPERPQPQVTGISGSGLLAQRGAYGAALGGQAGTASLTPVPSQAELEQLINDYLAQATVDAQAQLAALLPGYIAGAQADIQAQISSIAAQFQGRAVSPDQLIAAFVNSLRSSSGTARTEAPLQKLLAPHVRGALTVPSGGTAAPAAPAPVLVKPAKPTVDEYAQFENQLGQMEAKLDSFNFDPMTTNKVKPPK